MAKRDCLNRAALKCHLGWMGIAFLDCTVAFNVSCTVTGERRQIVRCASKPGDLVLDCFSGVTTSGVAAIRDGRLYLGIELNPEYAALSEERLKASPVWTSPMDIKRISLKLRDSAMTGRSDVFNPVI
jgi:hypothetical protein